MKLGDPILEGLAIVVLVCGLLTAPAQAEFSQQGAKLVANDAIGDALQGFSVSLSGDGNTALVGGVRDNCDIIGCVGAVWVYIRAEGVWSRQTKLVGTDAVGGAFQGYSVSLSGDGNTALVGGPIDNPIDGFGSVGAAWVYTRWGAGVWNQQAKLVSTDAISLAQQGFSVSLSGDGNTALVGGPVEGAAWVYTRSKAGVWSQQGPKLVGTDAFGGAGQGNSVSLSGDGNTALVGGPVDNNGVGAAWVYTRSKAGVWSQQGPKLVGTDAIGDALQGFSVSLSGDGNTAFVGGLADNGGVGGSVANFWL